MNSNLDRLPRHTGVIDHLCPCMPAMLLSCQDVDDDTEQIRIHFIHSPARARVLKSEGGHP